jgi:hypothetical protein
VSLTTAVLAATCATVLAASSAVAVSRAAGPAHAPARATARAAATPAPTTAPPTKAATIADLLLPLGEAVPRYDREPDATARTGAIDVTRAAQIGAGAEQPSAADKQAVVKLGFVRGYSAGWSDAAQLVVLYVYEWRTPAQAKTYAINAPHLQRTAGRWRPGTPNANASCRIRDGLAIDTVTMLVGRHTFTVTDVRDGNCQSHAEATKIAALQYRHAAALHA